jgi:hypothetical protein
MKCSQCPTPAMFEIPAVTLTPGHLIGFHSEAIGKK